MNLRIKNWAAIFENAESRKLKTLKWVALPNRMNTQGYTALVDHPNGAAHFGAWCALVEICSAREPRELRGTIPEADGSIGGISRCLGRISRLPPEVFEELIPRLLHDPEISWIEDVADLSGKSPDVPGESPDIPAAKGRGGELKGTELKGTGGEGERKAPAPVLQMPRIDYGKRYDDLYAKHPNPGYKEIGRTKYLEILTQAVNPEIVADAIDRDHALWVEYWRAHPTERIPQIGYYFEDEIYVRKPPARASPSGAIRPNQQAVQDDGWSRA